MSKPMSQMIESLNTAADLFEVEMQLHESEAHGGVHCEPNRASAVAFLAHRLGVRGIAFDYASVLLEEYDRNCPGCNAHKPKDGGQ